MFSAALSDDPAVLPRAVAHQNLNGLAGRGGIYPLTFRIGHACVSALNPVNRVKTTFYIYARGVVTHFSRFNAVLRVSPLFLVFHHFLPILLSLSFALMDRFAAFIVERAQVVNKQITRPTACTSWRMQGLPPYMQQPAILQLVQIPIGLVDLDIQLRRNLSASHAEVA